MNKILENYFTRRLKPMEGDWLKWFLSLVVILLTFWFLMVTVSWWLVVPVILVVAYHVAENYYQGKVGSSYFGNGEKVHLDRFGDVMELQGWHWDNDPALKNLVMSVNVDNTSFDLRESVPVKSGTLVCLLFFTINVNMDGASKEEILSAFRTILRNYPTPNTRFWFQEHFAPMFSHALADLAVSGKFSSLASRTHVSRTTLEQMIMGYLKDKLKAFPCVKATFKCDIQRFEETSLFPSTIALDGEVVSDSNS